MAVKPGELVVKCIGANLTRDTEWMGKMSPFLVIEVGPTRRQTGTHHRGGKTPVWGGEILKFQITNDPEMKLAVWDEEKNKKHDLVGDTIFFLNRITNDNIKKEEIEITYKGKSSGKIMLEFEFVPNTVTQMGMVKGMQSMMQKAGYQPQQQSFPNGGAQNQGGLWGMPQQQQPVMGNFGGPVMGGGAAPVMGMGGGAPVMGMGGSAPVMGGGGYQQPPMMGGGGFVPPPQMGQYQQPQMGGYQPPMGQPQPMMGQPNPMMGQMQMGVNQQFQQAQNNQGYQPQAQGYNAQPGMPAQQPNGQSQQFNYGYQEHNQQQQPNQSMGGGCSYSSGPPCNYSYK